MEYLLYLVGFVVGIAIFLYILSLYETGKEKIKNISRPAEGKRDAPARIEPDTVFQKKWKAHPGQRICPLCGSVLTRDEALYASPLKTDKGPKILILGCRYCWKEDDEVK